jgi:hypothetical protein
MKIKDFTFGSIRIDGTTYDYDVIIDHDKVRKRKKKASREFRDAFGHTPLSSKERIPWDCRRLVIGTGANGAMPVMDALRDDAKQRNVDLVILPTQQAIEKLRAHPRDTNAILHVTC